MSAKKIVAWVMITFAVVSTPASLLWFAKEEPPFVIVLGELGLLIPALGNLWQAEQMESNDE